MKHMLAIFAAILFVNPVFAQMEIGIYGGLVRNPASVLYIHNYKEQRKATDYAPVMTAHVMYNLKHWQVGISAALRQQQITYTQTVPVGCFGIEERTSNDKEQLVPIQLQVSRKFNFNSIEPYCGVAAGLVKGFSTVRVTRIEQAGETFTYQSSGIAAGAHAGLTWYITRKVGINTEVAASYMKVSGTVLQYDLIALAMTAGIRYRL